MNNYVFEQNYFAILAYLTLARQFSYYSDYIDIELTDFSKSVSYLNKEKLSRKNYEILTFLNQSNFIHKSNLDSAIEKGRDVFFKLYRKNVESNSSKKFLDAISFLEDELDLVVAFKSESVRVKYTHLGKKIIIDYDYNCDDSVFITKELNGDLHIEVCDIDSIKQKIGFPYEPIPVSLRITPAA